MLGNIAIVLTLFLIACLCAIVSHPITSPLTITALYLANSATTALSNFSIPALGVVSPIIAYLYHFLATSSLLYKTKPQEIHSMT
nr:hypothetical protein [Campylobacter anatolicus]